MNDDIDALVQEYADATPSDTFASYNSAITLAKEVRRLRRQLSASKRAIPPKLTTFKIEDADIAAIVNAYRAAQ